jgi:hypothetical protein
MAGETDDANAVAALGLVVDTVGTMCHSDVLDIVESACLPAPAPLPLLAADRASPGLIEFAHSRASRLSRRWNLWVEPIEMKPNAVRPLDWIMEKNPSLQVRAVFSGSLRSSVLACLQYDVPSGASEAKLARLCGVTRKAMHEAVDHLQLCSMIRRSRAGRSYEVTLRQPLQRVAG